MYYERLNAYHSEEDKIADWVEFFLDGIIEIAASAINTCQSITELRERDMRKVQQLGRASAPVTMDVLRRLYRLPTVGIADIVQWTGYTRPGAYRVIERLVDMQILYPTKEKDSYGQKYTYNDYVELFQDVEAGDDI